MSANVINSTILLGLGIGVGLFSLIVQTFVWGMRYQSMPNMNVFSRTMRSFREIWSEITNTVTVWNIESGASRHVMFVRMAVTFVLFLGIIAIVLATYDSVSSFWVYFILYLGIALLLVPVVGQLIHYIFQGRGKQTAVMDSD